MKDRLAELGYAARRIALAGSLVGVAATIRGAAPTQEVQGSTESKLKDASVSTTLKCTTSHRDGINYGSIEVSTEGADVTLNSKSKPESAGTNLPGTEKYKIGQGFKLATDTIYLIEQGGYRLEMTAQNGYQLSPDGSQSGYWDFSIDPCSQEPGN